MERSWKFFSFKTSSWNFASSYFVNSNFTFHAFASLEDLEHPTLVSPCQFLLTKMSLSRWSICNLHLQNVARIPTIKKIHFIFIQVTKIPRICHANKSWFKTCVPLHATNIMHTCNSCPHQCGNIKMHQIPMP